MFSSYTQDSFSEGVIYPGRALMIVGAVMIIATLLSSI